MSPTYDANSYWSDRLEREYSLRGTGHISYSRAYNRWLYRAKRRALRRALEGAPAGAALDIGSGTGWVVRELLRAGHRVEGCDIAQVAVRSLRDRYPEVTFFQQEIGTDPVDRPDGTYSLVTAMDVLYHVTDDERWAAAVAEIARLLRPGGRAIVSDGLGERGRAPAEHVRLRPLGLWTEEAASHGLAVTELFPLYSWLSRSSDIGGLRHLPDGVRGGIEYSLERITKRHPHMRIAVLERTER